MQPIGLVFKIQRVVRLLAENGNFLYNLRTLSHVSSSVWGRSAQAYNLAGISEIVADAHAYLQFAICSEERWLHSCRNIANSWNDLEG